MVGLTVGLTVGSDDVGEMDGDIVGSDVVGETVGEDVWWEQSPGAVSYKPAASQSEVKWPVKHVFVFASHPHWKVRLVGRVGPSVGAEVVGSEVVGSEVDGAKDGSEVVGSEVVGAADGSEVVGEADGEVVGSVVVGDCDGEAVGFEVVGWVVGAAKPCWPYSTGWFRWTVLPNASTTRIAPPMTILSARLTESAKATTALMEPWKRVTESTVPSPAMCSTACLTLSLT
jgi:hypothetical protein